MFHNCGGDKGETQCGRVLGHETALGQLVRQPLTIDERLNCTTVEPLRLQSSAHLHSAGSLATLSCEELRRQLRIARDELMIAGGSDRAAAIRRIREIEGAMAAKGCTNG
jgi:hypothetical protein